jgi:hypothetical protein
VRGITEILEMLLTKDGVADGKIANELSPEEKVALYFPLDFVSQIYGFHFDF